MTRVYISKKELRLIVTTTEIIDSNYILIFYSEGGNERNAANAFCIGFVSGYELGQTPPIKPLMNKVEEFL